jgi:hypothetical protein
MASPRTAFSSAAAIRYSLSRLGKTIWRTFACEGRRTRAHNLQDLSAKFLRVRHLHRHRSRLRDRLQKESCRDITGNPAVAPAARCSASCMLARTPAVPGSVSGKPTPSPSTESLTASRSENPSAAPGHLFALLSVHGVYAADLGTSQTQSAGRGFLSFARVVPPLLQNLRCRLTPCTF